MADHELSLTVKFDHKKYNSVAAAARLVEVLLVESAYKADAAAYMLGADLSDDTKKKFSGEVTSFQFDQDAGYAVGKFEWSAILKQGRKTLISLRASYMVGYGSLMGEDEEYVYHYFVKLSRFTTYPYFRGQFSMHTSASGLTLPPLPTLTERVD